MDKNIVKAHKLFFRLFNNDYKESYKKNLQEVFKLACISIGFIASERYDLVDYFKKYDNLTRATIASRVAAEIDLGLATVL